MCGFYFWKVIAPLRRGTVLKSALDIVQSKRIWSALESFIREISRTNGLITKVLGLMLPAMVHAIWSHSNG